MPFATINGITLAIRDGSLKQSTQEIGERGQAFDGTAYQAIRSRKRKWQFSTPPMSQADSLAWSALLNGEGVNWDFEADTYSRQGHVATVANAGLSVVRAKFGGSSLILQYNAATSAKWTVGFGSNWSVAFWMFNSQETDWVHIVKTSSGGIYVDGYSSPGYGSEGIVSVSSGILEFVEDSYLAESYYVDDLFALPAVVPVSWPAAMAAHGARLIDASGFTLGGDIVPAAVACVGQVTGSKVLQGIVGGSFVSNAVELEVEITEA